MIKGAHGIIPRSGSGTYEGFAAADPAAEIHRIIKRPDDLTLGINGFYCNREWLFRRLRRGNIIPGKGLEGAYFQGYITGLVFARGIIAECRGVCI